MEKRLRKIFDFVVGSRSMEVSNWLHRQFSVLRFSDCEDLALEGSVDLWQWLEKNDLVKEEEMVALWKKMSWFRATHLVRAAKKHLVACVSDWNKIDCASDDNSELRRKRESLWRWIDSQKSSDRQLLEMFLDGKSMTDIQEAIGYKSVNAVRNLKCRLVARMRDELPILVAVA